MPTTLVGLVLFTVFLLPGCYSSVQRRNRVPTRQMSALFETVGLLVVSVLTNGLALGAFGLIRALVPRHTPDVGRWLREGMAYAEPRVAYLAVWGGSLLGASCAVAFLLGRARGLTALTRVLNPVILDVSAWYHAFERRPVPPPGHRNYAYAGCSLDDGSYVGGRLAWYSTEVAETADRELVLTDPLQILDPDGGWVYDEASTVIVSARAIRRLSVTWVDEPDGPPPRSGATDVEGSAPVG